MKQTFAIELESKKIVIITTEGDDLLHCEGLAISQAKEENNEQIYSIAAVVMH